MQQTTTIYKQQWKFQKMTIRVTAKINVDPIAYYYSYKIITAKPFTNMKTTITANDKTGIAISNQNMFVRIHFIFLQG